MKPKTTINRLDITGELARQRMVVMANGRAVKFRRSEFKVLMFLVWAHLIQNNENPQVVGGRINRIDLTRSHRHGAYLNRIGAEVGAVFECGIYPLHEGNGDGRVALAPEITQIDLHFRELERYDDHEVRTMAAQIEAKLVGEKAVE